MKLVVKHDVVGRAMCWWKIIMLAEEHHIKHETFFLLFRLSIGPLLAGCACSCTMGHSFVAIDMEPPNLGGRGP